MRFAHLSDMHLGFQKHEDLQKVEQRVFERAMERCIELGVNFVLIPGDMFHVNIPEMRVQKYVFAMLRRVHDAGIPVYAVYGSHDFSPVSNSVIDLLVEAGYIIKVSEATGNDDGSISLEFVTDEKTGAKITGLNGLKVGRDMEYYEKLDRGPLESEPGFKIFLFHGGIADMRTDAGNEGEQMPLSLLPKGFSYYAGGHVHRYNSQSFDGYPHVVYPGTTFAGYHSDLEENARGERRGFVLVEFESDVRSVSFEEIANVSYEIIDVNAENRKTASVNGELAEKTGKIDPANKVVIVKIRGELASGKTADVDISAIRDELNSRGVMAVNISKGGLTSKEYSITSAKGSNRKEIERNIFAENIGQLRYSYDILTGNNGVGLAEKLLEKLGQSMQGNETRSVYNSRMCDETLSLAGLGHDS